MKEVKLSPLVGAAGVYAAVCIGVVGVGEVLIVMSAHVFVDR